MASSVSGQGEPNPAKKMTEKSRFGPEWNEHGKVVDLGIFNKTIIRIGASWCKMIITNSALRASWLSMTVNIQRAIVE